MITLRPSKERTHIQNANQNTWMTFDPENNTDPFKNGFGALKKLNENILAPGMELRPFPTKSNMLVLTYVRKGSVLYKGPGGVLSQNEFKMEKIGSEIKQDGFNASSSDEAQVFQFRFDLEGNEFVVGEIKKFFSLAEREGILKLIASSDVKAASLFVKQDIQMYSGFIWKGTHIIHELGSNRKAWLHVVNGKIQMTNHLVKTGDGAGFTEEKSVSFTAKEPSSVILFDIGEKVSTLKAGEVQPVKTAGWVKQRKA